MNRACKNETRPTPTVVGERMTDAGKEGPNEFDGTENLGEKSCAEVGRHRSLGPEMSPGKIMHKAMHKGMRDMG